MPLIEIERLYLCFQNKPLFRNFSLNIHSGEKLSLTGPSGSGKSSLMNCIMGFTRPQKGIIKIKGSILDKNSVWELRRCLGFVPQEPRMESLPVADILKRPFQYQSNRGMELNQAMKQELFELFQMEDDIQQKNIRSLSGGEKQRVALISALLLQRPVYLLDEITSALDDINSRRVIDYLCSRKDLTLIFATHDKRILQACGREVPLEAIPAGK